MTGMRSHQYLKRGAIRIAPLFLTLFLLLAGIFGATTVTADVSIAISGSFYLQKFQIPQGSFVGGPSIDVVVFNEGTEPFGVRMRTETPTGVNIYLSNYDFVLEAGGQQQVIVAVEVTPDALPGEYTIGVAAEAYVDGTGGIQVMGSAAQRAPLLVVGESATVVADTVGPSGQPIAATIRLFKVIDGADYEFAYSTTGHLEATVSPGHYRAEAYSNGELLAEEEFDVAAGQESSLTLTINTMYFEGFAINPAYNTETGELGYVQVAYTVTNVYQEVANAEVKLMVTLNGTPLEETSILSLNPFNVGRMGVPYNYSPANGWQGGTYGFSLRLYVDGQLYAGTQEQTLELGGGGSSTNWLIFVLVGLAGGLVIGGIIVFFKRRKKPDKPEKARKLEKHSGKGKSPEVGEAAATTFGLKRLLNRGNKITKKSPVPRKGTAVAKLPIVGEAAGTVFGLKRLFRRNSKAHKAAKRGVVPGQAAAGTGVGVAASAATKEAAMAKASARKDDQAKAETKESIKGSSVVDMGNAAVKKATGEESSAAVKEAAAAQDRIVAETSVDKEATAPTAKTASTAPLQVKSAADVKQAAAARRAEAAKPAEDTAPATPPKHAGHVEASTSKPGQAAKRPMAATPSTSPAYAQHVRETVPAGASTAPALPKKMEPLMVPSPFSPPKQVSPEKEVKLDKNSTPSRHDEAAQDSVAPPQEESPVTQKSSGVEEEADIEPAVNENSAMGAEARPNDDAGDAEDQAHQDSDEAKKKFVSPIRFLNR